MAKISIWNGTRSFTGDNNYDTVTFQGSEIGSVRFNVNGDDIQYRIFRDEGDNIIIFFVERRGYECTAEVYAYPTLEEAKKDYAFILRKAGVI
jgi:hypothetical protein